LESAKSRLRDIISDDKLNQIILQLLKDTLHVLQVYVSNLHILTADVMINEVMDTEAEIHFDDGKSLNRAIISAVNSIKADRFMLVMPDLPGLKEESIQKIVHLSNLHKNIIVPTGDGGTAIAILPADIFHQSFFGENSSSKIVSYCEKNRVPIAELHLTELGRDFDTLDDWKYWESKLSYLIR
jgi:2-phospho-L-lactate guanylyltransferase